MNETNILLQRELDKLRHDILAMASLVEEDIGKALTALRNGDKLLAKEVKTNDKTVNSMQKKIEDEAATLIATQHPVAGDLREAVTIFKIAGNLERIGDYAVHLAKAASKLSGEPTFRSIDHIEKMAETGQEMLRNSISAFLAKDTKAARNVASIDPSIDEQHKLLTEEILGFIKEKNGAVKKAVRVLSTSSYLERMGDHITNICEGIIYMVDSKHEELN
jgi:phosphate transport system protein